VKSLCSSFEPTRVALVGLLAAGMSWASVSCSADATCEESGTCAPPATSSVDDAGTTSPDVTPFAMTATFVPSIIVGTSAELEITIAREGSHGVEGRVTIELVPAEGITAPPVVIEADASTAKMTVDVAADRRHGAVSLVVRGTAEASARQGEATVTTLVRGKPGSIDTSFGVDGTFTFDKADSEATGVVVRSDGKIVLGGRAGEELALVQLLEDGTVDASFNEGATTIKPPGNGVLSTTNLVADGDGAISVVMLNSVDGSVEPRAHVFRVTRSGAPDATFGTGGTGVVRVDVEEPSSLAVAGDGALFIGGARGTSAGQYVLKLRADGEVDAAWGSDGHWFHAGSAACLGGPLKCHTRAIAVEPGGTLVACQPRNDGSWVHRVTINGVTGNLSASTSLELGECRSIAPDLTAPGFVFVGGDSDSGPVLAVRRLASDGVEAGQWGNRDSQFDAPVESGLKFARALASVGDKLVIGAEAEIDGAPAFGVARLTRLGVLDTTFAEKGYVTFEVGGKASMLKAMAIDALGRIILAGTNGRMVAVRVWP